MMAIYVVDTSLVIQRFIRETYTSQARVQTDTALGY
jgi:predicted nucleic acid-binding protein